jgi:hypothetical protein
MVRKRYVFLWLKRYVFLKKVFIYLVIKKVFFGLKKGIDKIDDYAYYIFIN